MNKGFQRVVFDESTVARHEVIVSPFAVSPRPFPEGSRIRIRGGFLTAVGTQQITFESDSTTLNLFRVSAGSPLVMKPLGGGVGEAWFECDADEAFNITLGQAVRTSGVIFYDIMIP